MCVESGTTHTTSKRAQGNWHKPSDPWLVGPTATPAAVLLLEKLRCRCCTAAVVVVVAPARSFCKQEKIGTFTYSYGVRTRVYTVIYIENKRISTKGGQRHRKRKNSVHMASLNGSNLTEISWKLDRVKKQKQVYLGQFLPKSGTMSACPIAGLQGCGLDLFVACMSLILAEKVARYTWF